jgi:hypothetical protein
MRLYTHLSCSFSLNMIIWGRDHVYGVRDLSVSYTRDTDIYVLSGWEMINHGRAEADPYWIKVFNIVQQSTSLLA